MPLLVLIGLFLQNPGFNLQGKCFSERGTQHIEISSSLEGGHRLVVEGLSDKWLSSFAVPGEHLPKLPARSYPFVGKPQAFRVPIEQILIDTSTVMKNFFVRNPSPLHVSSIRVRVETPSGRFRTLLLPCDAGGFVK